MTFQTSQDPDNSLDNFSQGIELDDPIPFGSDSDDDLITELFQYEDLNYTSLLMQTASKYRFSLEIELETTQCRLNALLNEDEIARNIKSNGLSLDIARKIISELAYLKAVTLHNIESMLQINHSISKIQNNIDLLKTTIKEVKANKS